MFIRPRALNLSLERPVYEPAVKNPDGTVVTPARRTTAYLGSVKSYARFADVPKELLDKLTDEEKGQLQQALAKNEPRPDQNLARLPGVLKDAGRELIAAAADKSPENITRLKARWHELEAAWTQLQGDAQVAGLRRTVTRKKAAAPVSKEE